MSWRLSARVKMPETLMRNVLVTGGAGFIGSNFVRHLLDRVPEISLVNLDAMTYAGSVENLRDLPADGRHTFVKGNICDRALVDGIMRQHKIDTVVHFAAESHVDRSILGPEPFIQTNVVGTFTLLESARQYWLVERGLPVSEQRFHHVSTDEVYGSLGPDEPAFTESTPYSPNSPYAASKAASDHLVRAYGHTYGMPITISNCSNNYGPYQFPEKLIPLMILNMLEGKPLPVYGDGKNVRDWLYVDDHCAAVWRILEDGEAGRTYNVGGENEWQNIMLVELLCERVAKAQGKRSDVYKRLITFVKDRPGHDRRYAIDCSRIKKELGWRQEIGFDKGIDATVRWYLDNGEWVEGVRSGEYRTWIEKNYADR
jgi:dTDP-glucose 4,6-dehydratase